MFLRVASDITVDSIVDGPGLRTVIWTQGCPHKCKGCHNPQTHDYNGGELIDIFEIIEQIKNVKLQKGVTISGGEPFIQVESLIEIVKEIKNNTNLDIWVYSGYTFEQLISNVNKNKNIEFLNYIDVLVDGKFEEDKKDINLQFRGSSNQRVIDVQKTLLEYKKNTSEYDIVTLY
ncbi:MAG: anaerobic ribonucleoside-triphosphate reductase activating protein [Romboutsia sp.]|nr:anaerobic ribonucleoside-triphosphate reductase activating protein [Romboutsia sp.]